jgi:hypothetical protein
MRRVTMDFEAAAVDPNHASSHGIDANGVLIPLPLAYERFGLSVLPAGGATWATVEDLATYVAFQLRRGVNADGRRVVSEARVLDTWEPQISVGDDSYSLGWVETEPYYNLRHIAYNGGNLGQVSAVAFLPDRDLGVAGLANSALGQLYLNALVEYVYELAFNLPHEADERRTAQQLEVDMMLGQITAALTRIRSRDDVIPYLGEYGPVLVRFDEQGRFVIRTVFGELALVPIRDAEGAYAIDGLFGGMVRFQPRQDGNMTMRIERRFGEPQPPVLLTRIE